MAYRNLTKVPKLCLVYFSMDKTTCIVETKKISRKESGEAFSNAGPESVAKVTLRTNGKLLDTIVIALRGELFILMFACFNEVNWVLVFVVTWVYLAVFLADNENQLNQEERSFVEDPVNAHLFAEEDGIMDKGEKPWNTGPSTKRTQTNENQDEVSRHSNNTRIMCFNCPYFAFSELCYEQINTV